MKAKIIIKKETEEEIFVTLPYYADFGFQFCKIESETRAIKVFKPTYEKAGIEIQNDKWFVDLVLSDKSPLIITKKQFQEAYNAALALLNQQSFIQDTEPATEEDCRDVAYEIYERNHDYQEALNDLR